MPRKVLPLSGSQLPGQRTAAPRNQTRLQGSDDNRTLVIACGALSHELVELIRVNHWNHLAITCLPAKYHHTPQLIPDALRQKIRDNRDHFSSIYIMYGDCGTGGGIDRVIEQEGGERIAGPHCFSFFTGNRKYAEWGNDEIRTFYLTDFFCQHFEKFVWKALALDRRKDMVKFVFGNYEKLVYIAQTENPELQVKAQDAARRLGLHYEYRFTGYGDMEKSMGEIRVQLL
jgi:hypothetical protein